MVKGEPLKIMVVFFWLTAAGSALLDNVTTVLLFTSVVFAICDILQINPVPFLVIEILAANIGGTATLIGDPPNIMIGSATGLGFNDFILNLGVPVFFICIFTCWPLCWIYRKEMQVTPQQKERMMILDEASFLTDVPLMKTAFPRMILSVIISNIYIYFAYLL